MASAQRGEWRIVARSTEQLATILEVSTAAIAKAEQHGRIVREPDGTWSVLRVVNAWRASVRRYLQRDPSLWIDPREELNVTMLIRRSRYAGARIELRAEGDEHWQLIPDPVQRINEGEWQDSDSDVDYMSVRELNGLVPMAGYWIGVAGLTARAVAKSIRMKEQKARTTIDQGVGIALLLLIADAEEQWLGPATAREIRNGRIPLSTLLSHEDNGADQGEDRP